MHHHSDIGAAVFLCLMVIQLTAMAAIALRHNRRHDAGSGKGGER